MFINRSNTFKLTETSIKLSHEEVHYEFEGNVSKIQDGGSKMTTEKCEFSDMVEGVT